MQPKLRLGKLSMLLLPLFVMAFSFSTNVSIAQTSTATVTTDKDDYPPGSTVYITGSGFSPNENVTLQVIHEGETGDNAVSGAHAPWTVSADANGNISAQWTVPLDQDELGATLKLTADGQDSKLHAEWTFTDNINFANEKLTSQLTTTSYGSAQTADFTYSFKVTGAGSGSTTYNISCTGLPAGVQYSPTSITTSSNNPSITLKITSGAAFSGTINVNVSTVVNGTTINGTSQTSTLTISKAKLTIIANNQTVPYGTSITDVTGAGSYTPSGFVNGDGASVIGGAATYTTTYTATTAAGTTGVTITPDVSNLTAANYSFTPTNGTITISMADQTISFGALPSKTYGDADFAPGATASSGLTVSYSSNNASVATIVNGKIHVVGAGSTTITASQSGDGNYNAADNVEQILNVDKVTATVTLGSLSPTYDGTPKAATASTTATGTNSFTFTYNGSSTVPTNAGSYNVVATLVNDNYKGSATGTFTIKQALNAITFTNPGTKTYGDADFNLIASATSGGTVTFEVTSGNATVSGGKVHITGAGDVTIKATQGGDANYLAADPVSQTFTVNKATATVTLGSLTPTYTGSSLAATATTNPSGLKVDITYDGSTTAPTNAGSYAVVGTINDANYQGSSTNTLVIDKATPSVSIDPASLSATYDGNAHEATATVTGVNHTSLTGVAISYTQGTPPVSVSSPTNAGDYTVEASFNGNGNYYPASQSGTLKIKKADQTITVTTAAPSSATYNTGFTVAATASSGLPVSYSSVAPLSNTGANYTMTSGTGTGTVKINQAGDNNYNPAPEVTANVTAVKANQTITWATPTAITYPTALSATQLNATTSGDGELNYSPALGTILGAGAQTLHVTAAATDNYNEATQSVTLQVNKGTPTISWSNPTGITYGTALSNTQLNAEANVPGSFTYTPAIGEYLHAGNGQKLSVSFTPTDANNYNGASKDVTIDVAKANPSIVVNGYNGIYDGSAHGAIIETASGARGENLSASINLGSSFTNVPGGTADWSFAGDKDHNPASGSASVVITKATPTIKLTVGGPYTYSNSEHGVKSATVSGVTINGKPEDLGNATVVYNGSSALPTDAGSYDVVASFSGNNNYNAAADQKSILVINKADAVVNVTGYSGTYDGNAHGATGSATGVGGADLKSSLNLGASFTDALGGTANWSFSGGKNYNDQNGSVEIAIAKATPTITLTVGDAPTYDGKAHHVQSAVVTGINNTTLGNAATEYKQGTTIVTDPTNAGDYAVTASYVATTNYNAATPQTGTLTINKANATISVTPYTVKYDGDAHTATGSAKGVKGETLSGLDLSNTKHTDAGSYNNDSWNFTDATGNYNDVAATTIANVISKADATINVTGYKGMFDNTSHGATGTATGVKGEDLSNSLDLGASFTAPTDGTVNWAFKGGANYNDSTGSVSIRIYAIPSVSLTTPSPVAINKTSIDTATFSSDVFNPVWVYTNQATGTVTNTASPVNNIAQLSLTSATPAVYSVYLTYTDGLNKQSYKTPTVYMVFYDPNAGFVTGGGWINSTPVDVATCATCTFMRVGGKANFGFESKYEKGKTIPSGNTEFQFQAGGMNFKSSNYEWLVISGTRAQYKGTGTINGTGNYGFLLTAVDGDLGTTKTADLFRIKIWDNNNGSAIVYDNQFGALDSDPLNTQLGGGSIVIHDTKTTAKATTIALQSGRDALEDESFSKLKVVAMPNPTTSQFTLQLQSNDKQQEITMIVVNESGRVIEMKQHLTAGQTIQLGSTYRPGIYFVQVIQGGKKEQVQLMKITN